MAKYLKVDVTDYLANPAKYEKQDELYKSLGLASDCMAVGCYDEFVPMQKDDPNNLKMAQYNIRDRFGFLSEEDDQSDTASY